MPNTNTDKPKSGLPFADMNPTDDTAPVRYAVGGEIRATRNAENQLVAEGFLVRFTTEGEVDTYRTFFTPETEYGGYPGSNAQLPIYFNHGIKVEVPSEDTSTRAFAGPGKNPIGRGTVEVRSEGLFVSAVLAEAGEYEEDIAALLESGVLGWSSGSGSHAVEYEPVLAEDGSTRCWRVAKWPLLEGSLTHTPAEYRNRASVAVRASALQDYGRYSWQSEYEAAEWQPVAEIMYRASSILCGRMERAADNIAASESMSLADKEAALRSCASELADLLVLAVSVLDGAQSAVAGMEPASVRSRIEGAFATHIPEGEDTNLRRGMEKPEKPEGNLSAEAQRTNALAALRSLLSREESIHALRTSQRKAASPAGLTCLETIATETANVLAALRGTPTALPTPEPQPEPTNVPEPTPVPEPTQAPVRVSSSLIAVRSPFSKRRF